MNVWGGNGGIINTDACFDTCVCHRATVGRSAAGLEGSWVRSILGPNCLDSSDNTGISGELINLPSTFLIILSPLIISVALPFCNFSVAMS